MFTGLVEEIGRIRDIQVGGQSGTLVLEAQKILEGLTVGDSIAVNGVCLTVKAFSSQTFSADVMPATLRATSLEGATPGTPVNLERALIWGGRVGGHLVSGHVDTTLRLLNTRREAAALVLRLNLPEEWARLICEKGSVSLDGTSLTVSTLGTGWFEVSLIPLTQELTVLSQRKPGDRINLECDTVAKYLDRLTSQGRGKMTLNFLQENGYA